MVPLQVGKECFVIFPTFFVGQYNVDIEESSYQIICRFRYVFQFVTMVTDPKN